MKYQSVNPATLEFLKEYRIISNDELNLKIKKSEKAFHYWSSLKTADRLKYINQISNLLEKQAMEMSRMISIEMGKPIKQSTAEIEKCILLCRYYEENAERILKPLDYKLTESSSSVVFEPSGAVYGVMPWNFPFWQVFRYAIPNLILGNTIFLKHASNVPQCAEAIEYLMLSSNLPDGVFQNLFIDYAQSEHVIAADITSGVTLTGSEPAGAMVASLAGKYLKKSVLELGGSDPFIVFNDALLEPCLKTAVFARFQNAGQSCIAAKRFIVHENIFNDFTEGFVKLCRKLKIGDPLNEDTELGPLARDYLLYDLENQVKRSVSMGAKVLTGGDLYQTKSLFYQPTVLVNVDEKMPVCSEEVFGPVAVIMTFKDENEAIKLANNTNFGLGASIWTQDLNKGKLLASKIQTGTVAINGLVKSHPALPFGGTKKSGFGRELGEWGLKEFANVKTINVFN